MNFHCLVVLSFSEKVCCTATYRFVFFSLYNVLSTGFVIHSFSPISSIKTENPPRVFFMYERNTAVNLKMEHNMQSNQDLLCLFVHINLN